MNLINGQMYWSISPSVESENHGETRPVIPWQGRLVIENRNGGKVLVLYRFSKETGEIRQNSNAYAICGDPDRPQQIFETEEQANTAYILESINYIQRQVYNLCEFTNHVNKFALSKLVE